MGLPFALAQAFGVLAFSGLFMLGFSAFWTFMVIELPKDLGPYSQASSLSMFMHRAFPMKETNDTAFEFKFEHVLILACVMATLMMGWGQTRLEFKEAADKELAKSNKKVKA